MADKKKNLPRSFSEDNDIYRKSNNLVNAKGKSTALGLKLFAIGIREAKVKKDSDGNVTEIKAVVKGQELRALFGKENGSFYTQIKESIKPKKKTDPTLFDWRIYMEDDENEHVGGLNVITRAEFENGELSLTINKDLAKDISDLKSGYTTFSLTQMIKMKSPYSIRIYEILKSYIDKSDWVTEKEGLPKQEVYQMTMSLEDLKETLGLISSNEDKKRKHLSQMPYTEIRRNIIEKAQKEINDDTGISFSFEAQRAGRGAKVYGVIFYITRKNISIIEEPKADKPVDIIKVLDQASILMEKETMTIKELRSICTAADFDIDKITVAYKLSKKQKGIENFTGWMIAAVKGEYQDTIAPRRTSKRSKKNAFNDFEQNNYNYEELEKQLLADE